MGQVFKLLLLCFSVTFAQAGPNTAAQQKVKPALVGLLDVYSLILFHPRMAQFDFECHRFEKGDPSPEKVAHRYTSLLNIANKLSRLEKERREMQKKANLKAMKAYQSNQEAQGNRIQQEFHREFRERRTEILREAESWFESEEKSKEIFSTIWNDILSAAQTIQRREGYHLFAHVSSLPLSRNLEVTDYRFDAGRTESFLSQFHQFLAGNIYGRNEDEHEIQLRQWLGHQNQIINLVQPWFPSTTVLYGGKDATLMVLQELFQMHKLSSGTFENLKEAWNAWKKIME